MARILLAEDDQMIARMISMRLELARHTVDTVENGKLAVEKALSNSYDAILMDMHMPEMDGHEAAQVLRDAGYSGLIVAVTASVMSRESEAAIKSGCDAYISKPVDVDFEQRIADLLSESV